MTVFVTVTDEQIRDALLSIVTTLKLVIVTVCTFELGESCFETIDEPLRIGVLSLLDLCLQFHDVLLEVMDSDGIGGQSGLDHSLQPSSEQASPYGRGLLGLLSPALPK